MTVIVQQSTDSNGNPQPMVYDQDTGKIIVDSNGYVINGGKRLVNIPTVSEYVNTPKTQTSGIQEAHNYIASNGANTILLSKGIFYLDVPVVYYSRNSIRMTGILGNENTNSTYTISGNEGTVILPSSKYTAYSTYMFNYAGSTSTNNNDGYVELDHFIIRGVPSLVGLPSSITNLANMIEFGVYVGPSGTSPGTIINTPVRKYIHDIKFNLGGYGINSYDSGGPSIYERLHFTYMGYTNGTAINNQSDMYIVDVDCTLQDVEFFSSFNQYRINQQYVSGSIPNGTMTIKNAYFGNNRGLADIRTGYYIKIDNVYQMESSSLSPAPSQLISIEGNSTYISLTNAVVQSSGVFTTYNTPSTAVGIYSSNIYLDNSSSFAPALLVQQSGQNVQSGSYIQFRGKLGNIIYGSLTNMQIIPGLSNIPTNPPASGTVYQNTNPYGIRLKIPITYNPSSTAAATLATGISSTSTVSTSTKVSLPSGLTAADGQILTYDMVVPAGWYYELVATNATIGTADEKTDEEYCTIIP